MQVFLEVISLLATGGQASVYLAKLRGQKVALKSYEPSEHNDKMFHNQCQTINRIQHEFILPFLSIHPQLEVRLPPGQKVVRNCILFPYMEKGDMQQYVMQNGSLPESLCKRVIKVVLSCMLYLYNQNILHCDIKPQNILISNNYDIFLTDFGLSNSINSKCAGSRHYMAPQILKGAYTTTQSQVFSLGVTLFYISMGCNPFKQAKITDHNYRLLIEKKYKRFWNQFSKAHQLTMQLKKFIQFLLEHQPHKRLFFDSLLQQDWIKGESTQQQFSEIMARRQRNEMSKGFFNTEIQQNINAKKQTPHGSEDQMKKKYPYAMNFCLKDQFDTLIEVQEWYQ